MTSLVDIADLFACSSYVVLMFIVTIQFYLMPLLSLATPWQRYSTKVHETAEEFDAKWVEYFNREDIDSWELKRGLNDLYGHDLVPEPKIVVAMIRAARRLNDVAMAIRILEAVKEKAAGNQEIYSYIVQEIRPTLDELGLGTPEELGLA